MNLDQKFTFKLIDGEKITGILLSDNEKWYIIKQRIHKNGVSVFHITKDAVIWAKEMK